MRSLDIKSKLTLRFIGIFGAIWTIGSLVIYLASAEYREDEFYRRLQSRAELIARLLIEEDQIDANLLRRIEYANPIRLPGEKVSVYNFENQEIFTTDSTDIVKIKDGLFDEIRLSGAKRWVQEPGGIEVLGWLYEGQYDRFVVIAGANDVFGLRKLANLRNILFITFFTSLLIAGMFGRLYAGKALKPINQVIDEVNQIDPSKLDGRVSAGNGLDEIAVLGLTFNKMLSRMQSAFESQRSFIAHSSHELRTPMTMILSQIDVTLMKGREGEEYKVALETIKTEVHKLSELTSKLLLLTRLDGFQDTSRLVRLDATIWQVISDQKSKFPSLKINVDISDEVDDEAKLQVMGNDSLLYTLFSNVVDNARKYGLGKEISVSIAPTDKRELQIAVSDSGLGIPEMEIAEIGKPFYRAKNTTGISGSGVGLSLVQKIVELHHGRFELVSTEGQGTTVTINFPLA